MSEYWVSHKKYFCKYCEIYITDDAPSRRQHESGLRHKGNRERFVRGLYKQGERRQKDLEEEKREMARIEASANAAFARDVSSGHASTASSSRMPQVSTSASKKPDRPTSVWSNYTTAQSLGITDPDEERIKAELERRSTQGIVGEWETVAPSPPPLPGDAQDPKKEDSKEGLLADGLPQKREAEASVAEGQDGRHFKLRKRTIGAGLGEIWDLGNIPIKLKSKSKAEDPIAPMIEPPKMNDNPASAAANRNDARSALGTTEEKNKSQASGWKRATFRPADVASTDMSKEPGGERGEHKSADHSIKKEDPSPLHLDASNSRHLEDGAHLRINSLDEETKPNAKLEEIVYQVASETTSGLFKKRKIHASGRCR